MSIFHVAAHYIHCRLEKLMRVSRACLQLQSPAGDTAKIKQILDQTHLEFGIAADHFQSFLNLRTEVGLLRSGTGPSQDKHEWCAQFMTQHRKEPIPCRVGRLRVFSFPLQLLFDSQAFNEEPDLAAERFNHLEQIFIGLHNFVTEKLHYAVDLTAGKEGKGKSTVEIRFCCIGSPREIWIARDIVDPGWFF